MKKQHSYISIFIVYLTFPIAARRSSTNITTVFHRRLYVIFIEIQSQLTRKKLLEKLGDSYIKYNKKEQKCKLGSVKELVMLKNQQETTFCLPVTSIGFNLNRAQIHSITKICFERPETDTMYLDQMYLSNYFALL